MFINIADKSNSSSQYLIPVDKIVGMLSIDCNAVLKLKTVLKENNKLVDLSGQGTGRTLVLLESGWGYITTIKASTINIRIDKLSGGEQYGKGNVESDNSNQ